MYRFQSPVPKRCSLKAKPCLPIYNDAGETVQYSAKFNGFNVVVEDQDAMTNLYTMVPIIFFALKFTIPNLYSLNMCLLQGYFGKGSLSTGYPSFNMREHGLYFHSSNSYA